MTPTLRAGVLAIFTFLLGAPASGVLMPGGWIGWAYLEEGGDLPLRVWFLESEEGWTATFDGVVWKDNGWDAHVDLAGERLQLTTRTPKGSEILLAGDLDDGVWAGTVDLFGNPGSFELLHAPELIPVPPGAHADMAGFYRMADGDILEARLLDWGEIVIRSIATGERRTLLATGEDRFLTGPARLVPTPVEARYEVIRGTGGEIVGLVREDSDGRRTRGNYFTLRERPLESGGDGVELAATRVVASDLEPKTGVVVIGGSSWQVRADVSFQVRSLAALGFDVVSWDKRGHGDSGGDQTALFSTTAADAVRLGRALRAGADSSRLDAVVYFGMSRGAWIAPLASAGGEEDSPVILFVPPATSPAVQEHTARLERLRAAGHGPEVLSAAGTLLERAWRFVAEDTDSRWNDYARALDEARAAGVPESVMPPAERAPEEWRWSRLNMLHDPTASLRQLGGPVLAVYGENDQQVLTSLHRPLMVTSLVGNPDVTIVTLPDTDHSLARTDPNPIHRRTGIGSEGFATVMAWARGSGLIVDPTEDPPSSRR